MTDESEAIKAIEQLGGRVTRDHTLSGSPVTAVDLKLVRELVDDHLDLPKTFKSLKHLSLFGTRIGDAGLLHIGSLTGLTSLDLDEGPRMTEAGPCQLWNLTRLTKLSLCGGWVVPDTSVQGIGRLQSLGELSLRSARITSGILEWIAALNDLRRPDLNGTRISDVGLQHLKRLYLTKLDLGWTAITDAGLRDVAELKSVEELDIARTRVGDLGVAELKRLPNLAVLYAHGTQVTDAVLNDLLTFGSLRKLSVYSTRVTGSALRDFRRARPEVRIDFE
jgi:internalin A